MCQAPPSRPDRADRLRVPDLESRVCGRSGTSGRPAAEPSARRGGLLAESVASDEALLPARREGRPRSNEWPPVIPKRPSFLFIPRTERREPPCVFRGHCASLMMTPLDVRFHRIGAGVVEQAGLEPEALRASGVRIPPSPPYRGWDELLDRGTGTSEQMDPAIGSNGSKSAASSRRGALLSCPAGDLRPLGPNGAGRRRHPDDLNSGRGLGELPGARHPP